MSAGKIWHTGNFVHTQTLKNEEGTSVVGQCDKSAE